MKKRLWALMALALCTCGVMAQDTLLDTLQAWAVAYNAEGLPKKGKRGEVMGAWVDTERQTFVVDMNDTFGSQQWTSATPQQIYAQVRSLLPDSLKTLRLEIRTLGRPIEHLAPYAKLDTMQRLPAQNYLGRPWVSDRTRPYSFERGLAGRHITVWASHGLYWQSKWNKKKKKQIEKWEWQRPLMNGDREDLLTPKIVYELLVPMLEGAGAVVWSPRERCPSPTEIITDNDHSSNQHYVERSGRNPWTTAGSGFAFMDTLRYGDNPFERGTARMSQGLRSAKDLSAITWYPDVKTRERLALYVSYKTLSGSTTCARYSVRHSGVETLIDVNQTMGGGTWVYLGDYTFSPGNPSDNCVTLTNWTEDGGIVTADAVRLGGGMGNVLRGDSLSGTTRYNEGARYSMQWAGMADTIYSASHNEDDYKDDINSRSHSTNYLCGGSLYNPDTVGLHVPIELSLAVHTDAGLDKEGGIIGSLGIATTRWGEDHLATGCSRLLSRDLAEEVLTSVCNDMQRVTGRWNRRELWDRNYSETRLPRVPSSIIEVLSHENPLDMEMALNPEYRFHIARAIYKGVLRFIYNMHHLPMPIIQPLPVSNLRFEGGLVKWSPTKDVIEPTAMPTHYLVQVASGNGDFDNGTLITTTQCSLNLPKGSNVTVRVRAINAGGASLPKEIFATD